MSLRIRKSMGDLSLGRIRASTLLFKGSSSDKIETSECKSHELEIPIARRRAAASMKLDSIGASEQKRRLRCTAVESDQSRLDMNLFSVSLSSALHRRLRLLGKIEACTWLEHPNFLMLAFDRYVRFLEYRRDHPAALLVAPLDVLCVWLTHVQRPLLYTNDVRERYGDGTAFMAPMILDDLHLEGREADVEESKQLWAKSFGETWEFELLVESLALRYEEYHLFCEASYEELTWNNPSLRRCHEWIHFGISAVTVLNDRRAIEEIHELFPCVDFCRLDPNGGLAPGVVNGLIMLYNKWIIDIAKWLLKNAATALAFPAPVLHPAAHPAPHKAVWLAHMCYPRQYALDCKRVFGGLMVAEFTGESIGKGLEARMGQFFDLPSPDYEAPSAANASHVGAAVRLPDEHSHREKDIDRGLGDGQMPQEEGVLSPLAAPEESHSFADEDSDMEFDEEYDSDCEKWDFS